MRPVRSHISRSVDSPQSDQPSAVASPATVGLSQWFTKEVQPHEPVLRSYLRGTYPTIRDVDDVVQESFLRIWRTRLARPIQSTKSFLFQVARHLAIDELRRGGAPVQAGHDLLETTLLDERPDAAEEYDYHTKVALLSDALAALPGRCREVVYLRKFKGLSQQEVAAQLGISVRTVESQFARGMRLCESHLRRAGVTSFLRDE